MKEYNHKEIEKKWQDNWEKEKIYKVEDKGSSNEYILVEFPYPSGNLHVGHWYAFAVSDIYARYRKMLGKNVLFPIGFDSFGLPAENAAIKNKVNPRTWTNQNMEYMEKQLKSMGAMFDWDRKIATSDPEYYKWTQMFFNKFLSAGLAYQAENYVNWCPSCKTVLANEQVNSGKCERCESEIEQRKMKEWKLKITDYAEKLLDGLNKVDFQDSIKEAQKNWIGKSTGTYFNFPINNTDLEIKVFTTRPDTYFGITYLVLAPENNLIDILKDKITNIEEVMNYRKKTGARTELDRISDAQNKTGVKLEGVSFKHPALGTDLPIFVADYVIFSYGTGAVMAVPAHDQRDYDFARKFNLQIKEVIEGGNVLKGSYEEYGTLINSQKYNGLNSKEAMDLITKDFGEQTTTYRLRDWSVSRQRFWGCPIPVIHCPKCGVVPVKDSDLPVLLPDLEDYTPNDEGKSPLSKASEWVNVKCPNCLGEAQRETDTLDTFIDSSWYFLRYLDPKNTEDFCPKEIQKNWMPVSYYSGGSEHTTMHLLYSRFFQKALYDMGLVVHDEPFKQRNNRGLILGPDGNKMSKSKGNVVDPDKLVERLGADTVRSYLAFIGPYNEAGSYPWDPNGIVGVRRFLERVYSLADKSTIKDSPETISLLHKTIKGVETDYQALKFNTAISKMMILSNHLEKSEFSKDTFKTFLKILAPAAPYLTEELWNDQGEDKSIHLETWPKYNEKETKEDHVVLIAQVDGKFRGRIKIKRGLGDAEIKNLVKNSPEVKRWIEGKKINNTIYVKDRIINFVLEK